MKFKCFFIYNEYANLARKVLGNDKYYSNLPVNYSKLSTIQIMNQNIYIWRKLIPNFNSEIFL